MNLISCALNCKYQKDGYCCLREYGKITDVISSPCVYFDEREENILRGGEAKIDKAE